MPATVEAVKSEPDSKTGQLILALDAGGTKTAVWLVESTSSSTVHVVGRGRSTSGNPLSVGFTQATRVISEAVAQARHEANQPVRPISRAVLSIAGALDPDLRSQFNRWARGINLADEVAIVPDVLPVLAAGTPQCCGVALISGTGSAAFARSADGKTCLCGGWGFLLGDEGSGYAIGRAAIRAALDDDELGREARSLSTIVLEFFSVQSAKELAKTIYHSATPRSTMASLAPVVIRAAEGGDALATVLVDQAAHELAQLATRAAHGVGLASGKFALAVTGGVLVSSARLRLQLQRELECGGLECEIGVVQEPLEGCLRLADPTFSDVAVEWR